VPAPSPTTDRFETGALAGLKSALRGYARRSSLSLPVLVGPARGTRIKLATSTPRTFVRRLLGVHWEPDVVPFLRTRLRTARVFADVGANIGYYTRLALAELPPEGLVVAFEPHPRSREELQALAAGAGGRVLVRSEPLGARDEDGGFAFGRVYGAGYASAREGLRAWRNVEERPVRFRSLDSLIAAGEVPAPDLLKIDVEGFEVEVLQGMAGLLERLHPTVAIECHSVGLLGRTVSFLGEVGYGNVIVARKSPTAGPWHVMSGHEWANAPAPTTDASSD